MKPEIFAACDQLLSATLNGSCQGTLLALLAGLSLRLAGRTNAATRHAVWFATLLLLALLIPAHYWRHRLVPEAPGPLGEAQTRSGRGHAGPAVEPILSGARAESAPAYRLRATPWESRPLTTLRRPEGAHAMEVTPALAGRAEPLGAGFPGRCPELVCPHAVGVQDVQAPVPLPEGRDRGEGHRDARGAAGPQNQIYAPATALPLKSLGKKPRSSPQRFLSPVSWDLAVTPKIPRSAGLVLLAAWLAVAGIKLALLARGLRQLRKLKGSSTSASPGLEDLFQRLRSKLAVKRMVRLKVAPSHPSALVLGFIHPVIILPAEAVPEAGLGQAEHILRHELAHVRRRDDWTNLVQRFLEAALFFHPAVWWISKQLSLEREIACDDAVLHQGVRPQSYALLLANLASRMTGRLPSVAPGASSSKSQLQQRITMILNTHRNTSPRLAKARLGFITSAAALIAVLAVCSGPRLVLAQSQPPTPAPATAASGGVNVLPPADVDPGPKFKKGEAPEPPDAPAPAALPEAAVGPVAPVAPLPPGYAAAGSPPGPGADTFVSTPPPPPQGASIEERLARLERMVQKLLAQQGPKHLRSDAQAGPKAGMGVIEGRPVPKFLMDLQQLAPDQPLDLQLDPNLKGKDGKDWKFQFDNKDVELVQERVKREVARATEQAMREVARATEQAKRATDQAKRAFEQAQRAAKQAAEDFRREEQNENAKDHDLGQNSVDKQLAALQRQREALEREVQKLVGQIERLEEDRERAAEEPAPRGRNKAAAPKPDSTPSPAPAAK